MKGSGTLQVGDRVRLKRDIAKYANLYPKRHKHVNWMDRTGCVVRVGLFNGTTFVKWDDRQSVDSWPTTALERYVELKRP
jgi:hypothetical protein